MRPAGYWLKIVLRTRTSMMQAVRWGSVLSLITQWRLQTKSRKSPFLMKAKLYLNIATNAYFTLTSVCQIPPIWAAWRGEGCRRSASRQVRRKSRFVETWRQDCSMKWVGLRRGNRLCTMGAAAGCDGNVAQAFRTLLGRGRRRRRSIARLDALQQPRNRKHNAEIHNARDDRE